ncbi:expressed unknown protein [Seminavis robusta]|uniref:Uncharacterized protein n=1 Tax=Seminavis robusta TaxID=568900 RepID=A0A9N8HKB9_9STRA|nr:expressed unknown protein [Seminavis robusta]|eukprot:Sro605_g174360.1 n/a (297) ;mRNA; f:42211-43101
MDTSSYSPSNSAQTSFTSFVGCANHIICQTDAQCGPTEKCVAKGAVPQGSWPAHCSGADHLCLPKQTEAPTASPTKPPAIVITPLHGPSPTVLPTLPQTSFTSFVGCANHIICQTDAQCGPTEKCVAQGAVPQGSWPAHCSGADHLCLPKQTEAPTASPTKPPAIVITPLPWKPAPTVLPTLPQTSFTSFVGCANHIICQTDAQCGPTEKCVAKGAVPQGSWPAHCSGANHLCLPKQTEAPTASPTKPPQSLSLLSRTPAPTVLPTCHRHLSHLSWDVLTTSSAKLMPNVAQQKNV